MTLFQLLKAPKFVKGLSEKKNEKELFFTLPLTLVILPNPDNLALLQIIKDHILSICFPILITNDFEYGPSLSMSYIDREVFSISIVSPHCRIDSTLSTLSVLLSIWPKHIDINSSADQSETLAKSWVKLQALHRV